MRRLKLTYYLLTLVCITFMSCISEDIISTYPSDKESGKTQIHLTMKLSETGNVNETSSPYDFSYERYINDVSIYIFSKDDKFIEQINNPQITGNDGDATRTIFGILEEDYSTYTNGIEIIVLTNLAKRGVTAPQLVTNQTKEDLYNALKFDYALNSSWQFRDSSKEYIPMWGISQIDGILHTGVNKGNLSLYRAIARVDVIFNTDGEGFSHFNITNITVDHFNNQGFCAPMNGLDTPSIPNASQIRTNASFFQPIPSKKIYRLYIPEYNNIDKADSEISKIKILGNLTTTNGTIVYGKEYTIEFKNGSTQLNILRNNLYKFNVTNITNEVAVTSSLKYEVEKWEYITVNVPSFN